MVEKLLSRKFLLAAMGVLAVLLRDWLGLSPEAAQQIVTLVAAYILGEGAVDAAAAFKKPDPDGRLEGLKAAVLRSVADGTIGASTGHALVVELNKGLEGTKGD